MFAGESINVNASKYGVIFSSCRRQQFIPDVSAQDSPSKSNQRRIFHWGNFGCSKPGNLTGPNSLKKEREANSATIYGQMKTLHARYSTTAEYNRGEQEFKTRVKCFQMQRHTQPQPNTLDFSAVRAKLLSHFIDLQSAGHMFAHLSFHLPIHPSIHLSIHLSIQPSTFHLSINIWLSRRASELIQPGGSFGFLFHESSDSGEVGARRSTCSLLDGEEDLRSRQTLLPSTHWHHVCVEFLHIWAPSSRVNVSASPLMWGSASLPPLWPPNICHRLSHHSWPTGSPISPVMTTRIYVLTMVGFHKLNKVIAMLDVCFGLFGLILNNQSLRMKLIFL